MTAEARGHVRFLVWDFDGTLAFRTGGWRGALCDAVARAWPQLAVEPERLRPHLRDRFPWHAPEVERPPCSADEWWRGLLPVLTDALSRGAGLAEEDALEAAVRVRTTYLEAASWKLFADTASTLEALRVRGWRHLVLSNHVPELPILVHGLGLSGLLDACYTSGSTGVEKPNPEAFRRVFADFPEARAGWMIGDNWQADIQGAQAMGMRAILVRSGHPHAVHRCDTLEELLHVVEP